MARNVRTRMLVAPGKLSRYRTLLREGREVLQVHSSHQVGDICLFEVGLKGDQPTCESDSNGCTYKSCSTGEMLFDKMAVILIPSNLRHSVFPTEIYAPQSSWVAIFVKHTFCGSVCSLQIG